MCNIRIPDEALCATPHRMLGPLPSACGGLARDTKYGAGDSSDGQLVEDDSVPEAIEALTEIARYWEGRYRTEGNPEYKGWAVVRRLLEPVLRKLDG